MPDAATAPAILAVPETAVPGAHEVRSLEATLAATSSSGTVRREFTIMGIPLGPLGSTLLGLYAFVLPLALYAAWISIALWDLIRRELSDRRRIGWMALVLALPVVGPVAYFGLGGSGSRAPCAGSSSPGASGSTLRWSPCRWPSRSYNSAARVR
jgi:hypothetical protein